MLAHILRMKCVRRVSHISRVYTTDGTQRALTQHSSSSSSQPANEQKNTFFFLKFINTNCMIVDTASNFSTSSGYATVLYAHIDRSNICSKWQSIVIDSQWTECVIFDHNFFFPVAVNIFMHVLHFLLVDLENDFGWGAFECGGVDCLLPCLYHSMRNGEMMMMSNTCVCCDCHTHAHTHVTQHH